MRTRSVRTAAALVAATALALPAGRAEAAAGGGVSVAVNTQRGAPGGRIPAHFVGFSIEWSLIERYMGPNARPAFANLLSNLGTGVLRIGGSSQDLMPFEPDSPNTNRVITPDDLDALRATLDAVNARKGGKRPPWGVVLGTAMAPRSDRRPFISPEHARMFVTKGVRPAFAGAGSYIAGIELGNEPDLTYHYDLDRYLADLSTFSAPGVTGHLPIIAPNTSEDILTWTDIDGRTVPTRFFWDWPKILDTAAPRMKARAGAFGAYASDHFYPLARTCVNKPYRCPSTGALLSDEHMASLDYQVYAHTRMAAQHGLGYRLEETSTAAGRGADGVSNVAASAAYALDMMFHTACPQPPNAPSANTACGTGGVGVNFHNAEVRAFFHPEEGNAYYNAINYDTGDDMGAPTAAPVYYATLLFSRFAQGATGLRPLTVSSQPSGTAQVKAWQVDAGHGTRRLFLINKGDHPAKVRVAAPARSARVSRMTPFDPAGTGRTLDAPQVRIDGRQVAADGTWPGFHPTVEPIRGGRMAITLGAGETAVISMHTSPR